MGQTNDEQKKKATGEILLLFILLLSSHTIVAPGAQPLLGEGENSFPPFGPFAFMVWINMWDGPADEELTDPRPE